VSLSIILSYCRRYINPKKHKSQTTMEEKKKKKKNKEGRRKLRFSLLQQIFPCSHPFFPSEQAFFLFNMVEENKGKINRTGRINRSLLCFSFLLLLGPRWDHPRF